jgi:thiosulfate dehydrogenase (quinone) large subunit
MNYYIVPSVSRLAGFPTRKAFVSTSIQSAEHPVVPTTGRAGVFGERWLRGAAVVRILFGLLWAINASFKWLPKFNSGATMSDELGNAALVHTPVIHQWLQLWSSVGLADPGAFAKGIAVIETVAALGMILGAFSNAVFIGTAMLSFGIWSGAEAFHLPFHDGMTDLGPSSGYVFASLALFFAAAGSRWSVDQRLRPALGRFTWLAAPAI